MNAWVVPANSTRTEQFDWGRITWLVSGALGNSQSMTFGRVVIRAGRSNPRHSHPNCDEILHLLTGRLEHDAAGEKCVLNPGDTVSIPRGVAHNALSLGPDDAVMVVAYSCPDRQVVGE